MKLSAQVRSTHNHDGAVVLDIRHGQMFRANPVGSRIMELLELSQTETEIIDRIALESNTESAAIASDVSEFLRQLQQHHLLEIPETTTP